jgi:hypothetical protein
MSHFDGGAEALHDEYQAATLKKAGLPDHLEVSEMRLEYGIQDVRGIKWFGYASRESAEEFSGDGDTILVREVISTEWREATPRED